LGARKVTEPTGSLVDLVANNRNFLARGYVDSDHPIAVRVVSRDATSACIQGRAPSPHDSSAR
jgi:23S rRNA G2069 N7-methylase RlmK/C1962 C5-methylase RlmI